MYNCFAERMICISMSDLPRLFVSHSSLDSDLTRQVCDRLASVSGKPGYDVLVDVLQSVPFSLGLTPKESRVVRFLSFRPKKGA
jgi:hypothetical protein